MKEFKATVPGYRLAAKGRPEAEDERLELLEQLFDPISQSRRKFIRPGWRCLEVGAGRGSMATWLAQQVGPDGHVVATDIDVRYLDRLNNPNVEVRRHNILEESLDALGPGSFDLVSSRLMLFWLPGRQDSAIQRMTELLRPGGWLVDEDGDWGMVSPVDSTHPLSSRYQEAWQGGEWWAKRGYDPFFGRKLPGLFERCGLQKIRHEATAEVVRGCSPWARWWKETLEGIRAHDHAEGILSKARELEYQSLIAPLDDPSVWFQSQLLHACWGQRLV
jgi:SAM-dependent methyltransferase